MSLCFLQAARFCVFALLFRTAWCNAMMHLCSSVEKGIETGNPLLRLAGQTVRGPGVNPLDPLSEPDTDMLKIRIKISYYRRLNQLLISDSHSPQQLSNVT